MKSFKIDRIFEASEETVKSFRNAYPKADYYVIGIGRFAHQDENIDEWQIIELARISRRKFLILAKKPKAKKLSEVN